MVRVAVSSVVRGVVHRDGGWAEVSNVDHTGISANHPLAASLQNVFPTVDLSPIYRPCVITAPVNIEP